LFAEGKPISINTGLRFRANKEKNLIGSFVKVQFEQEQKPFLIIEICCHFQIDQKAWEFFKTEDSKVVIPRGFITHLAMLSTGTARGVLHSKTEGTQFNHFHLPIINVAELIKEDLVI
jgi:hypothetical protein